MDYDSALNLLISNALAEDIGNGDHSTLACIDPGVQGNAQLIIKQDGILAGIHAAERIFKYAESAIDFTPFRKDGEQVNYGDIAFEVSGSVLTLLTCERLVLNAMQKMTGIATLTHLYVSRIKGYDCKILDTRKTTPNFRLLEKEAVRIGGGYNHRFGLYDMIMLKDNHIDFCGGIEKAIIKASDYVKSNGLNIKIEVETRSLDDVKRVMATGLVDRIMLDNFKPEKVSEAVAVIDNKYETEASGGITIDNILDYAKTGVQFISTGAIIHHAVSHDISLKAVI